MAGIVNFRDMGGYKTNEGKVVKKGLLYRSGQLVGLSEQVKKDVVDQYHIKTIVDFRQEKEIREDPDDRIDGTVYHHIDIMDKEESGKGASLDDFLTQEGDPYQDMKSVYYEMIMKESAQVGYHRFLTLVSEPNQQGIIFHCFAGKDRTGIGAMLILEVLGVSREDIMRDYLQTNQDRKEANAELLAQFKAEGKTDEELKKLDILLCVEKAYLEEAWKIIHQNYGSFDNYIRKGLQHSPEELRKAMKRLYVE